EEKLIRTGSQSALYGVVIADSLQEADELESKLEQLAPVARVTSMVDYLTENQDRKLRTINDIKALAAQLSPAPPSSAPVNVTELNETLFALEGYLGLALERLRGIPDVEEIQQEIELLRSVVVQLREDLISPSLKTVSRLTAF